MRKFNFDAIGNLQMFVKALENDAELNEKILDNWSEFIQWEKYSRCLLPLPIQIQLALCE